MSLWTRITNALASNRLNRELNEEYEAHIAEAIASGRNPEEARRAFGSLLRHREHSRQHRVLGWLESLRIDLVFGLRQLKRNKVTSAAAILSLGLAMGACVGAFRLIDALLWRPLPIAHPERLYALWHKGIALDGNMDESNAWTYPVFLEMRKEVANQADLLAVSFSRRFDVTYSSDAETEKATTQFVSASLFRIFGLKPALGRLLIDADDNPNSEARYAVLSYDYWTRRFRRDPAVIGKTLRLHQLVYQIVGVAEPAFTGTEAGTITEIFVPAETNPAKIIPDPANSWLFVLASLHPGTKPVQLASQLETIQRNVEIEQAKQFSGTLKEMIEVIGRQSVFLDPAFSGVSDFQSNYQRSVMALGALAVMILLIACVNVANLMTAQATARSQEMALRISIGAGRLRLIQLVLVESLLMALASACVGAFLAVWSPPFVVSRISTLDTPVRLVLPADGRVSLFAVALILAVTMLFGLLPALRASSVEPLSALKGSAPHARKRLMLGMIAVQVAVCTLVVFYAGLFVITFQRLANRDFGFNPDNLVMLETSSAPGKPQPYAVWDEVIAGLRQIPGVEQTAMTDGTVMLSEHIQPMTSITLHGAKSAMPSYFGIVSPTWRETMQMQLIEGRDFRLSDTLQQSAIVNQTFARAYFPGIDAIGQRFTWDADSLQFNAEVVGIVHDTAYRSLRDGMQPIAFFPLRFLDKDGKEPPYDGFNIFVRLKKGAPLEATKRVLRQAIAKSFAGLRVFDVHTQQELIDNQSVRERLLAMLAFFFAGVALLLAGIGLFGVLSYTVLQRRREIGIRIAIGARRGGIAGLVVRPIAAMIAAGAAVGLCAGLYAEPSIDELLYKVKATDPEMLTLPAGLILSVAILALIPAIRRAIQTDPAEILRSE
jgi:predicted permease